MRWYQHNTQGVMPITSPRNKAPAVASKASSQAMNSGSQNAAGRPSLPSLPVLDWGRRYDRETFVGDGVAALIVTIMLIPQSLAYALLAGLPPEVGLYASVAPLLLYAVFGSSRVLAVGPVAPVSASAQVQLNRLRSCRAQARA